MKRLIWCTAVIALCASVLVAGGCKQEMVTVRTGEVVFCTEGEIVSDTVEEIEVPADEVADYSVTTRIITCDLHSKLAALYKDAQDAIAAGDMSAARDALTELVSLDPSYRRASEQLDEIESGGTPNADSGTGAGDGTDTPPTDGGDGDPGDDVPPTGPIMTLASYVPDELTGYSAQELIVDTFALTRNYLPTGSGGPRTLVIVAEQFKDEEMATAELERTIKSTYSTSGAAVTIGGNPGYFGVRNKLAIVAFVDGGVLVAVEGSVESGSGASLEESLLATAEEISK